MKSIIFLALFVCCVACQNAPKANVTSSNIADTTQAFTLITPDKWTTEHIAFPIPFAPSIPYTGTENLRFAPGFESTGSTEHWSYAFLWWLNGTPTVTPDTLREHLTAYYRGLVAQNIKNMTAEQKQSIHVGIASLITKGHYTGQVQMIDYTDVLKPMMKLNLKAVVRVCGAHTAVLVRLSPQPWGAEVWKQLDAIDEKFICHPE